MTLADALPASRCTRRSQLVPLLLFLASAVLYVGAALYTGQLSQLGASGLVGLAGSIDLSVANLISVSAVLASFVMQGDPAMIAPAVLLVLAVSAAACKALPVVVFDRGVLTECPVTFVNPIGGYGWGIQTANFIAEKLPKGGKVLALRILPGVDVLETRWSAANRIFKEKGIEVVGAEFTDGDNAETKAIVEDYINRFAKIDAIWMDAGATVVAAIEAFEDAGQPHPIITGEDQEDFLVKWKKEGLTAFGPTYPTYQWRSPVIAAVKIFKGEPVIGPTWKLPQPVITQETLDKYVNEKMPPLHHAMCGCEDMPGYPENWGGKK